MLNDVTLLHIIDKAVIHVSRERIKVSYVPELIAQWYRLDPIVTGYCDRFLGCCCITRI